MLHHVQQTHQCVAQLQAHADIMDLHPACPGYAHQTYSAYIIPLLFPCRESAVHGMGSVDSLRKLRSEAKAAGRAAAYKAAGPRPRLAGGPTYDARLKTYTLPFPGERFVGCMACDGQQLQQKHDDGAM